MRAAQSFLAVAVIALSACGGAAVVQPDSASATVEPGAVVPAAEAAPKAVSASPAPVATDGTLPALDPDAYFQGKTGGTFGKDVTKVLPANRRVGVAGFRVVFITDNSIKAQVRASYFGGTDRSGANVRMDVALSGVDAATMQAITDRAYAQFLAQLAAAGREVVPPAELQPFLSQVEISAGDNGMAYRKEVELGYGKQTGIAFAPTGMPLWFSNWDTPWGDKSPFKQHNIRSFATASADLNAILVAPLIVVDFAQMSSSGNRSGFIARDAEVGATLSMSVSGFSTPLVRAEKVRSGIVTGGDDASVTLTQPVISEIGFATLQQVEKTDNSAAKGVLDVVGGFMGLANAGGAAKSRSAHQALTNDQAYAEAAADALTRASGAFAAWFRKYPSP